MSDLYAAKAIDNADFSRTAHYGKADPFVDCPRCGGIPDYDEEGKPYTCFFCCDSGVVRKSVADEEERLAAEYEAERAAKEAEKRKRLGVPDGYGYYIDEVDGELRLIPPRKPWAPVPVEDLYIDDIPF